MAKKPVKKDVIPKDVLEKLKRVKDKFFKDKDDTIETVKKTYLDIYKEDKEEHSDKGWNEKIFHRRALTKLKNKKKGEKLGGAIDKYYGIVFGVSKIRDLSANRRAEILNIWKDDPEKVTDEGLIMVREEENPETGEIEKVPIYDEFGSVIPRDNVEFRKRKNGTTFPNPTYNHAIGHTYRRNVSGICLNTQGIKGVFMQELRDKSATDLEVPLNCLVKFSGKTIGTDIIPMNENKYIDNELLIEMINNLEFDIEEGKITKDFANEITKYYNNLLIITRKTKEKKKMEKEEPEEELKKERELRKKVRKELEITFFKLRSTKGTAFTKVDNENEFENVDFPKKNGTQIDINLLYKKYFYPFTCDCSNLLKYHTDNRYIDGDPDKINYDEIVCLQDVNLIQINMEASMGGNYTMYIEDESLFNKDINHLNEDIDTIRILVPTYLNPNYGQDSKLNLIGSPVQFQAQDDDNKDLFETVIEEDKEGNKKEIQIPVLGFPLIMVHGIYPIPEYMVEVDMFDLTLEDNVDEKEPNEPKKKAPKKSPTKKKTKPKDIKDAIKDTEELEEELEEDEDNDDNEEIEEPDEETEELEDEDLDENDELW